MSTALKPIDVSAFKALATRIAQDRGPKPKLAWISVSRLRIDPSYQREIGRRGRSNVLSIAAAFDWSKFGTVIVADIGGGLYAIIDGQHRTAAALLCGIAEVPCQVVVADRARQADAFASINAQVTAITPMQLHAARVAAGNPDAVRLATVCAEAGVTICRYPVPASHMKTGETLAAGKLDGMLKRFGHDVLIPALMCITKAGSGNPGFVRAPVVEALCAVLDAEPDWRRDRKRLIAAMSKFNFAKHYAAAATRAIAERCSVSSALVDRLSDHIERSLEKAA